MPGETPTDEMGELDDESLQSLYVWVDQIPLSRSKKNITRDFADGVLVAEVVKHYFPSLVELHNYSPANNVKQKIENWYLLNRKVFKKLKFEVADEVIRQITNCRPWVIEHVLLMLKTKLERLTEKSSGVSSGGGDQKKKFNPPKFHSKNPQNNNFQSPQNSDRFSQQPPPPQSHYPPSNYAPPQNNQQHHYQPQPPPPPPPQHPYPHQQMSNKPYPQAGKSNYNRTLNNGKPASEPGYDHYGAPIARPNPHRGGDPGFDPQKDQEILAKDETIQILQAKIRRLEHLVHLKDIRIDELSQRVEQMTSQSRGNRR